jgi:GNAT superfamily N-acetyltransferase
VTTTEAVEVPHRFRLRELAPQDGPALARLFDASPDTGMIRFRPVFTVDPVVALTLGDRDSGVVVERDDGPGLVGLGLVRFDDLVIRGRSLPYALLHSLVVHPEARRQGVARAIIGWRRALAEERLGADATLVATIQRSNEGSFKAASRWATQLSEPLSSVAIGLRSAAPSSPPGGSVVRPARPGELDAFAAGYAAFHADFDLWSPEDAPALAEWFAETPIAGTQINELWVAVDPAGNLLAGLGASEVRRVSTLHVDHLPRSISVLNTFMRIVPRSGWLEQVRLSRMWFRTGAEAAAHHLFESIRWEGRQRGNVVLASFDPRGPLRDMLATPRWLPKTAFSLAIRSPETIRPDHPIDGVQ